MDFFPLFPGDGPEALSIGDFGTDVFNAFLGKVMPSSFEGSIEDAAFEFRDSTLFDNGWPAPAFNDDTVVKSDIAFLRPHLCEFAYAVEDGRLRAYNGLVYRKQGYIRDCEDAMEYNLRTLSPCQVIRSHHEGEMRNSNAVGFLSPMQCLLVSQLPRGSEWTWEIKMDGYRALAVRDGSKVALYSRRKNSLNVKFPYIVEALGNLPTGTVLDGEVVALDDKGRAIFNLLQKFRSGSSRIQYHVFDLPFLNGKDLTRQPLGERRKLLQGLGIENDRIKLVRYTEADPVTVLAAAKKEKLEGIIGKRTESQYQAGLRTGEWIKLRINAGQEFVIGGYTPSPLGVDAILIGYYEQKKLIYVARVRNGLVPASRKSLFEVLKRLHTGKCPFANLPERHSTQWGEGLTAEKMNECIWIKPNLVARVEFLEWTTSNHLRHARFTGLRSDKPASKVFKEIPTET